jgi:hypothetical protein
VRGRDAPEAVQSLARELEPTPGEEPAGVEDSFRNMRSQTVSLMIEGIEVSGDSAEARGRQRSDVVANTGERTSSGDVRVAIRLRRASGRWVISEIGTPR